MRWVPVCRGALDLQGHELSRSGYELLITPARPGPPIFLWGEGAAVWRALLADQAGIAGTGSDLSRLEALDQLRELGVAECDDGVSSRVSNLSGPWLESVQHELVYALLAQLARENDIEILFIKGPTLFEQGLRTRKHSGDVDCWVRAGDRLLLASAMREWGWEPYILPFTHTTVAHALTLNAGAWGCAIDVHTSFPGIGVRGDDAFEFIFQSSEVRQFAGTDGRTPNAESHAVIFALHELRPVDGREPTRLQHERARAALQHAGPGVLKAVDALGAGHVLGTLLTDIFPGDLTGRMSAAPLPRNWSWRKASDPVRRYALALKELSWNQKIPVVWRLIWPSRPIMLQVLGLAEASCWSLAVARVSRLLRAIFR